jgi:hypothetical protein
MNQQANDTPTLIADLQVNEARLVEVKSESPRAANTGALLNVKSSNM